jgi:RNA polymerase primary sigma factor
LDAHYLDSKNTIVDSISDTDDTKVEDHQTQDKVSALLECLNENETAVICMHFGLRGYDQTTLEEVGKEVRFTRERIRQIQVSALKKLAIAAEAHQIDLALIGAA